MSEDSAQINLTHHFLIAMPSLRDEAFQRSVVYLCDHSENGAMGIVINKPSDISLADLFDKVDLPHPREILANSPVFQGGPVHTERGFVLHTPVRALDAEEDTAVYASTLTVPGGLEVTTSRDVLEAMSQGGGPERVLVSLGYAAWGGGQLESELSDNAWLTVGAEPHLIFDTPVEQRYAKALKLLGVDEWALSSVGGRA
jgi:putative transcriptional regulator